MPKLGEKGIVQIVLILLLLAGLGSGLYLSQNTAIFQPKAFDRSGITGLNVGTMSGRPVESCKNTVANFYVSKPCSQQENGFRRSNFSCSSGNSNRTDLSIEGSYEDLTTCKTVDQWFSKALEACMNSCNITTTPIPSIEPFPSCAVGILCAVPPPNCQYVGGNSCSCGELVCQ